jgi:hypothetical protein
MHRRLSPPLFCYDVSSSLGQEVVIQSLQARPRHWLIRRVVVVSFHRRCVTPSSSLVRRSPPGAMRPLSPRHPTHHADVCITTRSQRIAWNGVMSRPDGADTERHSGSGGSNRVHLSMKPHVWMGNPPKPQTGCRAKRVASDISRSRYSVNPPCLLWSASSGDANGKVDSLSAFQVYLARFTTREDPRPSRCEARSRRRYRPCVSSSTWSFPKDR